jgi:hypothetical protein
LNQLGRLGEEQEHWQEAADYYLQAIEIYAAFQDKYRIQTRIENLARVWAAAQKPGFSEKPGFLPGDIPGRLAAALGVSPAEAAELLTTAA